MQRSYHEIDLSHKRAIKSPLVQEFPEHLGDASDIIFSSQNESFQQIEQEIKKSIDDGQRDQTPSILRAEPK